MAIKRIAKTGEFSARDAAGTIYTLHVFTNFIDASTSQNPHAEVPGLKEIRTAWGHPVNWIERGKYQIVGGEALTSADPNAV